MILHPVQNQSANCLASPVNTFTEQTLCLDGHNKKSFVANGKAAFWYRLLNRSKMRLLEKVQKRRASGSELGRIRFQELGSSLEHLSLRFSEAKLSQRTI